MAVRSVPNLSGFALSLACVIHCILMPVCLASLPSWGLSWLASPNVHKVLALVGVMIGMVTLVPGWRAHQRNSVLVFATVGLLIMNYSAFFGADCCTIPTADASAVSQDCCHDTCCSTQAKVPQAVEKGDSQKSGLPVWGWLFRHPTVLGATCLAWAHCLNGRCSSKCCQRNQAGVEHVNPGIATDPDSLLSPHA